MTLGAQPLSVPQAEPSSKIDDLADAFETERRLLDELARVLSRQRDGLAANDMAVLDEFRLLGPAGLSHSPASASAPAHPARDGRR